MQDIDSYNVLFDQVIADYHFYDDVDRPCPDPHRSGDFMGLLYQKCWIDTVQWHLEDLVREPTIDPFRALGIKRRIDASNQARTELVEQIDDFFLEQFKHLTYHKEAKLNTESPAWAIDRLSILALKIFHMREQKARTEVDENHRRAVHQKLDVLLEQRKDLTLAISQLIADILAGKRIMKVYRQMKMYNDPSLNPILYGSLK